MNENEFKLRQAKAIEQLRQMNSKVNSNQPQKRIQEPKEQDGQNTFSNDSCQASCQANTHKTHSSGRNSYASLPFLNGAGLPFADMFLKDKDTALIIGLLLILMSEKTDKILLFALIYILT